jgi:hypothetical protein
VIAKRTLVRMEPTAPETAGLFGLGLASYALLPVAFLAGIALFAFIQRRRAGASGGPPEGARGAEFKR